MNVDFSGRILLKSLKNSLHSEWVWVQTVIKSHNTFSVFQSRDSPNINWGSLNRCMSFLVYQPSIFQNTSNREPSVKLK